MTQHPEDYSERFLALIRGKAKIVRRDRVLFLKSENRKRYAYGTLTRSLIGYYPISMSFLTFEQNCKNLPFSHIYFIHSEVSGSAKIFIHSENLKPSSLRRRKHKSEADTLRERNIYLILPNYLKHISLFQQQVEYHDYS
jgi:hypothetical protein